MGQSKEQYVRRQLRNEKGLVNASVLPRLPYSSIDGGALKVTNLNGDLVAVIGEQWDGTHTTTSIGGTPPSPPTVPLVTAQPGGLTIYWDGTYADDTPTRMDFKRVTFHAVTDVDDFDPLDPAKLAGEITFAGGGEAFAMLPPVEHFVFAVTWTEAGLYSVESDAAFGTPTSYVDDAVLEELNDSLDELNNVKLPQLELDLEANTTLVGTLTDTTLPELQDNLDAAAALVAEVNSRGTDLIANGTGSLGTNANFSSLDVDLTDPPTGATAAFKTKTTAQQSVLIDALLPFNPSKAYRYAWKARQTVTGATNRMYGLLAPYDAQNRSISPYMYMFQANTTTTLAQALNPGDTTIRLTSSANWYGRTDKAAGGSTHLRTIIIWGWTDENGKVWPPFTYSRDYKADAWADGGINTTTHTITLRAPWDGPAVPAGRQVSNGSSGGSYIYTPSAQNVVVPEDWTFYSEIFDAGIMPDATAASGRSSATWSTGVPPGTATIKTGWLANYPPSPANATAGRHSFAAVSFSDAAAGQGWRTLGKTTIDGGKIEADSILAASIGADQITAVKIATNAITAGKIDSDAVTANTIKAGAVVAGKINTDAVTAATIAANAVVAGKIDTDAVTANTIKSDAVTALKIAADAVLARNIKADNVLATHIKANEVNATHITADALTGKQFRTSALTTVERLVMGTNAADSSIYFYSAHATETQPGFIRSDVEAATARPIMKLQAPVATSTAGEASITLGAYETAGRNGIRLKSRNINIEGYNATGSASNSIAVLPTDNSGIAGVFINGDGSTASKVSINTGSAADVEISSKRIMLNTSDIAPLGEVKIWAGLTTAVPTGWALCDGSLLSRTTYAALFAVISTRFNTGGEATTDFRLPNLVGRIPVGLNSADTTMNTVGKAGGARNVTLTAAQSGVPQHYHQIPAAPTAGFSGTDDGPLRASGTKDNNFKTGGVSSSSTYGAGTNGAQDASQAHENMPPFVTMSYIIRVR